ncbi:MAG: hypothetical protein U5K72_03320 [Balneolaceae bacterium]|nr:hypothetical protein [Balneolaceae bacterium]
MEGTVPFIAFKKPFEEVIIADHLLTIEHAKQTIANDQFRVFPVPKKRLVEEGSEFNSPEDKKMLEGTYVGDKWGGKYLRAPDIFFTILEKGEGKLEKLKEIADIEFGIKTGANDFFYLTKEEAEYHKIEEDYLKPAILKTDEIKIPILSKNDFDGYFFWCSKEKDDLQGTNALKYINWGEQQPNRNQTR